MSDGGESESLYWRVAIFLGVLLLLFLIKFLVSGSTLRYVLKLANYSLVQ
jgi:hypothetical protein